MAKEKSKMVDDGVEYYPESGNTSIDSLSEVDALGHLTSRKRT